MPTWNNRLEEKEFASHGDFICNTGSQLLQLVGGREKVAKIEMSQ